MSANWPKVRLDEVLRQIERPEAVDASKTYRLLGVRWYGQGLFVREEKIGADIAANRVYSVGAGDFVYNRLFAWKGSFAVVGSELDGAYVSNEFPCFSTMAARLDPHFLFWYFRQERAWSEVLGLSTGATPTSRNRLKESAFLAMEIPLPSLAEQRRVVSRLEELAVEIRKARDLCRRAAEETNALMGSHLGAEFSALAKTFPVHLLGELTSHIVDGPHQTPRYLPEGLLGIPFITVKNMVTGILSFTDVNYISDEDHRSFTKRCKAEPGDVLYSKDGATRGRPCLVDTTREFSYFVSVALIKPLRDRLDGRYLVHSLGSSWIKDRMIDKSRGDMIPHIVLREIQAYPVPLPPLSEQRRIVAELDALQADVAKLKRLQAATATQIENLLSAVLDRAFKAQP